MAEEEHKHTTPPITITYRHCHRCNVFQIDGEGLTTHFVVEDHFPAVDTEEKAKFLVAACANHYVLVEGVDRLIGMLNAAKILDAADGYHTQAISQIRKLELLIGDLGYGRLAKKEAA